MSTSSSILKYTLSILYFSINEVILGLLAAPAQGPDGGDHRRALQADQHINAEDIAAPLRDDRVHGQRTLAGARVADDQLPLAFADRDHGIDHLAASQQRAPDEIAGGDRW